MSIPNGPTTLSVPLSQSLRQFVEFEAQRSGCITTAEYIRKLIRAAQSRAASAELESALLAGLSSGEPIDATHEYFEAKSRELLLRHGSNPL